MSEDSEEAEFPTPIPEEQEAADAWGPDALAYYAPFHFYSHSHWGIYIRDYGVAYLVSKFKGNGKLSPADNWALRAAYYLLFEHEYFHFQTEAAATRFEILSSKIHAYRDFFHHPPSWLLEEALANARAHLHLKDHESAGLSYANLALFDGFATSWMTNQSAGYGDFAEWARTRAKFKSGLSEMTSRWLHRSLPPDHLSALDAEALALYTNVEYSLVPVFRVRDSRIPWLGTARLFPRAYGMQVLVHTRDHPPPHFHIEFLGSDKKVRVDSGTLKPLPGEQGLSISERRNLEKYLGLCGDEIQEKVRRVQWTVPSARAPEASAHLHAGATPPPTE